MGDVWRIAIVALGVNLLLLVVFLRSLVAPLVLLATSVLALAATLGITTFVFQDLLGYDELTYYVPFAAAVLLVSLGSDYNVFIAGQISAGGAAQAPAGGRRRRHAAGEPARSASRAWRSRRASQPWRSFSYGSSGSWPSCSRWASSSTRSWSDPCSCRR